MPSSKILRPVIEIVQEAIKSVDEGRKAGKTGEMLEARQAPATTPRGGKLLPRDQGMYTPGVPQVDLPRQAGVDKARAAGKKPKYTERMQDLLDSPTARKKVDKLIEKGEQLGMREWYGTEPLRQAAMDVISPAQYESLMAQLASASQRNPVDQQNLMGSYLYHLQQQGKLDPDAILLTNKIRGQEGIEAPMIEFPEGYGSLAQSAIFNRAKQIAAGDIEGALPPERKLGTFYRNLMGNLQPVTVDVNAVRGPIIERGDPRWLVSQLVEKDPTGKVVGKYRPREMVERGEMSMREARDRPGFWEAAPSGSEYAGFEDLWQRAAKRGDVAPAEAQALGWYGSADVTALKTKPELYVENLERLLQRTAEVTGKSPLQVLREFLKGEEFLKKADGGAVNSKGADMNSLEQLLMQAMMRSRQSPTEILKGLMNADAELRKASGGSVSNQAISIKDARSQLNRGSGLSGQEAANILGRPVINNRGETVYPKNYSQQTTSTPQEDRVLQLSSTPNQFAATNVTSAPTTTTTPVTTTTTAAQPTAQDDYVPFTPEYQGYQGRYTSPAYTQSGRIVLELNSQNRPDLLRFLDNQGRTVSTAPFSSAPDILRAVEASGVDLRDLRGIGQTLDEAGIGYRPYELNPGTGSDKGLDIEDLIAGGMGTAYDWRVDPNVARKGPYAAQQLQENAALFDRLGLTKNPQVTTERGIDPSKFRPLIDGEGNVRSFVAFNPTENVAVWYRNAAEAGGVSPEIGSDGGGTYDLSNLPVVPYTPRNPNLPVNRNRNLDAPTGFQTTGGGLDMPTTPGGTPLVNTQTGAVSPNFDPSILNTIAANSGTISPPMVDVNETPRIAGFDPGPPTQAVGGLSSVNYLNPLVDQLRAGGSGGVPAGTGGGMLPPPTVPGTTTSASGAVRSTGMPIENILASILNVGAPTTSTPTMPAESIESQIQNIVNPPVSTSAVRATTPTLATQPVSSAYSSAPQFDLNLLSRNLGAIR